MVNKWEVDLKTDCKQHLYSLTFLDFKLDVPNLFKYFCWKLENGIIRLCKIHLILNNVLCF